MSFDSGPLKAAANASRSRPGGCDQGWLEARFAKLHERQPEKVLWHYRVEDPQKNISNHPSSVTLLDGF